MVKKSKKKIKRKKVRSFLRCCISFLLKEKKRNKKIKNSFQSLSPPPPRPLFAAARSFLPSSTNFLLRSSFLLAPLDASISATFFECAARFVACFASRLAALAFRIALSCATRLAALFPSLSRATALLESRSFRLRGAAAFCFEAKGRAACRALGTRRGLNLRTAARSTGR